ncbi:PglD-related sugar-binding protein [Aquirhabdus parva]|uniref:Acetyltransferase n=1 Tax=Aquirhabdus parva TaxID=2283318 RepID=A0A345P7Y6_9GAMM|nr:acetyltransferase [Aquirhabdus parva]AXI03395.1 acetyltransferase [Aquirhabdus parva]
MRLYGIVGAGGFGREVLPVAESMLKATDPVPDFEIVFVVEYGQSQSINGHRVLLLDEFLASDAEKYFNIAIADAVVRERIAEQMIAHGIAPFSIQALNSMSLSSNQIGEGAILCPFTLVTANATIGRFFHANIYSYIAHDCQIGNFVTFAPNVHCNGHVIVEDYAYIGTGAILKQGSAENPLVIGRGAIVGMGAVVTKSVAPYTTVVGNPAKPLVKH